MAGFSPVEKEMLLSLLRRVASNLKSDVTDCGG
jgi:hypothetical protein